VGRVGGGSRTDRVLAQSEIPSWRHEDERNGEFSRVRSYALAEDDFDTRGSVLHQGSERRNEVVPGEDPSFDGIVRLRA